MKSVFLWLTKRLALTLLVLGLLLYLFPTHANADQLAWITEAEAQKARDYLTNQKQIILYCGCCTGEEKKLISLETVRIRHPRMGNTEYKEYFEVVITDKSGQEYALDLAYVHVNVEGKALCLGKVLNLECDPCIEPWDWATYTQKSKKQ